MRFADIRDRIVNNPGFQALEEVKRAGYRIVKERNGERYFLVKPETLKPLLVRLGEVAEVRFGIKTGANEFFYLEPVGRTVKEVAELREQNPMAPVRVKNGAGWEGEIEAGWLRPVIKSPREIRTLRVRLEDLRYLVFIPPEDVREAMDKGKKPPLSRYPLATAYIRWGERQGYHQNRTCASRHPWWLLPEEKGNTFWAKELRERVATFISKDKVFVDCRLYSANLMPIVQGVLNSTLSLFMDEMGARQYGGGGGPRTVMVYEVQEILILNPDFVSATESLLSAFDRLSRRTVRSIFEELGFALCRERRCEHPEHPYEHVRPEDLTLEQVRQASPDRFELDAVVFDVLGLTEAERLEVYRAVVQLVKERLVKARSV